MRNQTSALAGRYFLGYEETERKRRNKLKKSKDDSTRDTEGHWSMNERLKPQELHNLFPTLSTYPDIPSELCLNTHSTAISIERACLFQNPRVQRRASGETTRRGGRGSFQYPHSSLKFVLPGIMNANAGTRVFETPLNNPSETGSGWGRS